MGDIYLREYVNNEVNTTRIKGVGIRTSNGIKNAKQIYVRPGPAIITEWENDPTTFLAQHPDNNPNTDPNFFNWHPVWSMMVTFHYGDNTTTTQMVSQGSEIGPLPSAAALDETFTDGQVMQRTFSAWSRSSGSDSQVVDETYVVNQNLDLYALYDYIVTFKDGGTVLGRKVVERNELLGSDNPVVEGKNDDHGVWALNSSGTGVHYSPSSRVNSDLTLYPATDIEITFNLNGSGRAINEEKFYVSTVTAENTWGQIIANGPVINAEGYGNSYSENAEYDFTHTGKIFDGWWTQESGGSRVTSSSTGLVKGSGQKVLYAHWKDNITYQIWPLEPDGYMNIGKASVLDSHYGECVQVKVNLGKDNTDSSVIARTAYSVVNVPPSTFLAQELSRIQIFSLDANSSGDIPYYKQQNLYQQTGLTTQIRTKNRCRIGGATYFYETKKDRNAYWFSSQMKYKLNGESTTQNFVAAQSCFDWDSSFPFYKCFDFSTGKFDVLCSNEITSLKVTNLYENNWYNTENKCQVSVATDTSAEKPSMTIYLTLGVVNKPIDGQRWLNWSRAYNSSGDAIGYAYDEKLPTANYEKVWKTTSVTLPDGDNSTLSWTAKDISDGRTTTQDGCTWNLNQRDQVAHHFTIIAKKRSDGEKYVLSQNVLAINNAGGGEYTVNNPEYYNQYWVMPFDENERYYNEVNLGTTGLLTLQYYGYATYEAESKTVFSELSILPSRYITVTNHPVGAHKENDLTAQKFDHWTVYTTTGYWHPGSITDYNPGQSVNDGAAFSLTEDKIMRLSAVFKSLYSFSGTPTVNSTTKMVTWNAATSVDDPEVTASSYKIIGEKSDGTRTTLADNITNLYAVVPELDTTYTKIYVVAQNADKSIYNSISKTLNWRRLHFNSTNGINLSFTDKYILNGETVGTLPTIQSSRENYSFDHWYWSTVSDNITINSDYVVNTSSTVLNIYPYWTQTGYLVTFDNGYPWYGVTNNLYKNKSTDNTYTSVAARNVSVGSSTSLPSVSNITSSSEFAQLRSNSNSKLTWTFLGWATSYSNFAASQSNGEYIPSIASANILAAGSSYTPSADVTLYGVWKLNQYTVTFNTGGAEQSNSSALTNIDNQVTVPTLTKDGYDFSGWFNSSSGGAEYTITNNKFTAESNTTLYAQWQSSAVTVTYSYIDRDGLVASYTDQVVPTSSYYVDDIQDKYYHDSNGQTKLFKNWTRNGMAVDSDDPQVISTDTTFVAKYRDYFGVTEAEFLYNGSGFFSWDSVYNYYLQRSADAYEVRGYNTSNAQWTVLVSTSSQSGRSYLFDGNQNFTKLRFYAIDESNDCANYIEYNLTWYNLSIYEYNDNLHEQGYHLEGDRIVLPGTDSLVSADPYQLIESDTAPYYKSVYTGYRNDTKNRDVVLEDTGYDFESHYIVNPSDFTNRSAVFKQQVTTSVFLDTPVVTSANYDTKTVSWSNTYGEYFTMQKNGTEDARNFSEPLQDYGGTSGGQNLWEITDIYDHSGEFENEFFLYRVRVIAYRQQENGSTYAVYSDWYEVTGHPSVEIYGAEWGGTSTTTWTRTDGAAAFSDPVPYISGENNYSSPFDDIMPWSGMTASERTGGTMVAIPKFWYKLTQTGNKIKVQIANGETNGFSVSPAHMDRGDSKGERDVVYIGRYHCASDYKSKTGVVPVASITRSSARTSIHNLGSTIWQSDFAMRFTIWLLYIVEFADWNSQSKIGYGCGNGSATENMGYTDSMPYHTGTTLSSRTTYGYGVQYRNIEGLWDNVRDWCDGAYYNSNGMNIILNPVNFGDSANGINVGTPSDGYPSRFAVKDINGTYPVFIPSTSSGSNSTYSCDKWAFGTGYPCLCVGGYYNRNRDYGLFCVHRYGASYTETGIGARLMELP